MRGEHRRSIRSSRCKYLNHTGIGRLARQLTLRLSSTKILQKTSSSCSGGSCCCSTLCIAVTPCSTSCRNMHRTAWCSKTSTKPNKKSSISTDRVYFRLAEMQNGTPDRYMHSRTCKHPCAQHKTRNKVASSSPAKRYLNSSLIQSDLTNRPTSHEHGQVHEHVPVEVGLLLLVFVTAFSAADHLKHVSILVPRTYTYHHYLTAVF